MKRIGKLRIIPIFAPEKPEQAVQVASALQEAGLDILEITFRSPVAEQAVRAVLKEYPDMLVGAGTLLAVDQLQRAVEAGAKFGVSPGFSEVVTAKAFDMNLPFLPGVLSPSEISRALALGCKLLKFYPTEVMGGLRLLETLSTPFAHTGVKLVPTGGITAENAPGYLALPIVTAVAGSWLAPPDVVKSEDWKQVKRLATAALNL